MTHVSSPHRLTNTQCKCQWATNPESIPTPNTQPEVYVITMTVCLLWAIELFGSRCRSLTPIQNFPITPRVSYIHVPRFSLEGVNGPLLDPHNTHYLYLFYVLNRETFIGRRPKYELTTHSSTMMMDDPTHAHTPNIMQCPCAYAMLMSLYVLMLHVCCTLHGTF